MREITSHKVNGLNEALKIEALGGAGSGGAYHAYSIEFVDANGITETHMVEFQHGPIAEAGVNGISNEALLAIVADRLECFQAGEYATDDNAAALEAVRHAMAMLHKRTLERVARGVEGTSAK